MGFSDYRKNKWLAEFDQVWLALHYDNPEIAGALTSEVFGGSYTRVAVALSDPSSGAIFIVSDAKFTGLPATNVLYVAGWDARVNGNLEFSAPLPSVVRVISGTNYTVPAGSIALSMANVTDGTVNV